LNPRFLYDLTDCPIGRALELLGEKWTLMIVREAFYGVRRFDDFARALGCGRGVLSARLKALTQAGVFERRDYATPGERRRAEYRLTRKGQDLFPALLAISQWSERWDPPSHGAVARVTDRVTGARVVVVMTSDGDARALSRADVEIRPGPGARPIAPSRGRSVASEPQP
jgi:DNA-binding HxlR family transcriptional regulator